MRNQRQSFLINSRGSLRVFSLTLLENSIVNPQIDITFPVSLLHSRRHISDCSLVYLSSAGNLAGLLLQASVVEPCVIVERFLQHLLLEDVPSLHEHGLLHLLPRAVLLLEFEILLIQSLRFLLGDVVERILVKDLRSFKFFESQLELGELDEEVLVEGLVAQLGQGSLVEKPRLVAVAMGLLELGRFDVGIYNGEVVDEFLQNASAVV